MVREQSCRKKFSAKIVAEAELDDNVGAVLGGPRGLPQCHLAQMSVLRRETARVEPEGRTADLRFEPGLSSRQ
jgi:hypothetical protein